MSNHCEQFYINGQWVTPQSAQLRDLVNPADETVYGRIAMGSESDIDAAVDAAHEAFEHYSKTSIEQRIALLERIISVYKKYYGEMVQAITREMGAPLGLSKDVQAAMGIGHFSATLAALKKYSFSESHGSTEVRKEPIGVVGLITPWNWPMNQVVCKVAPALAAGCTVVLKPSQESPLSATLLAKILDEAEVPPGVFNLVHGSGSKVGDYLSRHPKVDMISFTGSTQAGVLVSQAAAHTIKRVALELGGKSANIILDDADFGRAVASGIKAVFSNSGQTCTAPTRMLVPRERMEEVIEIAKEAGAKALQSVGDPMEESTAIGPVANRAQFEKIQQMIALGIDEGATLICGGTGRPDGLEQGFYVKPTIFANCTNHMTIAREEIFGPVLVIIPYDSDDEAVAIANDSPYGLSGYVSGSHERAQRVAAGMRTGMVHINGARPDLSAPFGGYKQSGNGREWGVHGLEDFLEIKSVMGWNVEAGQ